MVWLTSNTVTTGVLMTDGNRLKLEQSTLEKRTLHPCSTKVSEVISNALETEGNEGLWQLAT